MAAGSPPVVCDLSATFVGLKVLRSPLQTPRACGTSSPARRTNASPNSGCVTGRTTARTALMRAPRSAVRAAPLWPPRGSCC